MSWTSDNYPKIREHLPDTTREVFDRMANQGMRLRDALDGAPTMPALRHWRLACAAAGTPHEPCHTLRTDYAIAAYTSRQ